MSSDFHNDHLDSPWLETAFGNSFKGIGQSMTIGGTLGVATTAGMMYASGINPITLNRLRPNPTE